MISAIRRSAALGARRVAALPAKQADAALRPCAHAQRTIWAGSAMTRPLGVTANSSMQKIAAAMAVPPPPAAQVPAPAVAIAAPTAAPATAATTPVAKAAEVAAADLKNKALVFEIGLTFLFSHYVGIFQSFARCMFQAFRPLLILFVFGQIIKAAFFMMGAPLWFSFYSIWLFEVGYGLAQCAISFIFISFFYNNCMFARVRPTAAHFLRQQREKLARATRALAQ